VRSTGAPPSRDQVRSVASISNSGSEYPALVALTPSGDKVVLHIEVAGGLPQLDGTAKKKIGK
jgi:hypothetical protein